MFNNPAGKINFEERPGLADLHIIFFQVFFLNKSRKKNTKDCCTEESDSLTEKHCYFIAQTPLR